MADLEHRVVALEQNVLSFQEYLRRQDKHNEKMESFMEDIKGRLGNGDGRFAVIEQRVKQAEEDIDNIGKKLSESTEKIYNRLWSAAAGIIVILVGFLIWYIQSK